MVYNYDQWLTHNKKFYNDFIELKTVGWGSYIESFNNYTFNFYKSQVNEVDKHMQEVFKKVKV